MKNKFTVLIIIFFSVIVACNIVLTKNPIILTGKEISRFPSSMEGTYVLSSFDSVYIWLFMLSQPFDNSVIVEDTTSFKPSSLIEMLKKKNTQINLIIKKNYAH
jgi:hypothetical protein